MPRLLIVDDDAAVRDTLRTGLAESGHEVETAATAQAAIKILHGNQRFDIVLLDLGLPDKNGLEVLADMRKHKIETPVLVISAETDMSCTVRAMRDGAFDFIAKPFNPVLLDQRIARALRLRTPGRAPTPPPKAAHEGAIDLVGSSPAMREVLKMLGLLAASRATVLIRGESGTGKELAARVLHQFALGAVPGAPFVAINCAALPAPLVEAEIFGYMRGAFTGAEKDRAGKLEAAGEGMLFLDEIGEIPLETQVKLLRVLQERQFERLGETESRPFRARIVAATHRDLEQAVKNGGFREDLYYRLNVATVTLPPLRERIEDLPIVAETLLRHISVELGRPINGLSAGALSVLGTHDWPGNVRELRNVLTRAAVKCRGTVLLEEDLELGPRASNPTPPPSDSHTPTSTAGFPTLDDAERDLVSRALAYTRGHKGNACTLLGISRPTLLRKIRRYNLDKHGRVRVPSNGANVENIKR